MCYFKPVNVEKYSLQHDDFKKVKMFNKGVRKYL